MISFLDTLKPLLSDLTKTRRILHSGNKDSSQSFLNFYNVPETRSCSGAEAENNRLSFSLTELQDSKSGKVKIELRVCGILDRERKLKFRAKSGTTEQVAEYLAQFLNSVTTTYEPSLQSY